MIVKRLAFFNGLKLALDTIRGHKLRAFLTVPVSYTHLFVGDLPGPEPEADVFLQQHRHQQRHEEDSQNGQRVWKIHPPTPLCLTRTASGS